MLYRVTVALLWLLVAWGMWSVSQNCSYWIPERRVPPVPDMPDVPPTVAPAPVAPAPAMPVPESWGMPSRVESVAKIEPAPLTPQQRRALLDQRLRECVYRQGSVPVPQQMERWVDLAGHEFQQVSVVRIEPDGIHIRHGKGLDKIDATRLPADLKARFFIEDELALRYRELMMEKQRLAAEKARARKPGAEVLGETPQPPLPHRANSPTVTRGVRCEMCGIWVPEGQIKVYQALMSWKDKKRRSVQCCPKCVPYSTSNLADPYMPR